MVRFTSTHRMFSVSLMVLKCALPTTLCSFKIAESQFENFEVFASNNVPLNIAGYLDFSNFDRMTTDIRMRTRNFQVVSAKETHVLNFMERRL